MEEYRHLYCPLTLRLFSNPVTASDGHTYEKEALVNYRKTNTKSPLTTVSFQNIALFENRIVKFQIDELIMKYPELADELYNPEKDKVKNSDFDFILSEEKFEFPENMFNDTNVEFLKKLLSLPELFHIYKHIIDNIPHKNLENMSSRNQRIIHYVCQYGTLDHIRYIVEKKVNLEVTTMKGSKPIHFLCCHNNSLPILKYFVSQGVSINDSNNDIWKPIHFITSNGDFDSIKYFINLKLDELMPKNNAGKTPVDCINGNIKLFADQKKFFVEHVNIKNAVQQMKKKSVECDADIRHSTSLIVESMPITPIKSVDSVYVVPINKSTWCSPKMSF
jgi:hypothetical protein